MPSKMRKLPLPQIKGPVANCEAAGRTASAARPNVRPAGRCSLFFHRRVMLRWSSLGAQEAQEQEVYFCCHDRKKEQDHAG